MVLPIGFVTAIDPAAKQITVRTDAGPEILVLFDERTTFRRLAPGAKHLKTAVRILASDIRIGDRLLARGVDHIRGKTIAARSVFVKAIASKKAS